VVGSLGVISMYSSTVPGIKFLTQKICLGWLSVSLIEAVMRFLYKHNVIRIYE